MCIHLSVLVGVDCCRHTCSRSLQLEPQNTTMNFDLQGFSEHETKNSNNLCQNHGVETEHSARTHL